MEAMIGPAASASFVVTYGTRASSSGCRKLCSSAARASRRSSVQEVTDHTSALTPHSCSSTSAASSAHGTDTPEASSCTFGPSPEWLLIRCRPRTMPSMSTSSGSAGCSMGSL